MREDRVPHLKDIPAEDVELSQIRLTSPYKVMGQERNISLCVSSLKRDEERPFVKMSAT